ncbi:MAG: hypothetical protein KBT58_07995 [Bizionia sp.]|nr:hypothetical protein [Bizionia sp.]
MKYLTLMSCLFVLLFLGCNEVNPDGEKEVRKFVKQWNDSHTQLKSAFLSRDYMEVVNYYGLEYTRVQVQRDKELLFQQFPEYTQHILNDQIDIIKEKGSFLVSFTKQVKYNGIEAVYPSYLVVIYRNGNFKINVEGVTKDAKGLDAPIFPNARQNNTILTNNRQLFGDFNGDGLSDYANVISPEIMAPTTKNTIYNDPVVCKNGDCTSVIVFSNDQLKDITIKGAYKSQLENLKDLNSDGADEIGFWDIKPTSKTLYVFNALNGLLLCDPIVINTTVHKELKLIDVIKKSGPNKITVTYSEQVNDIWVLQNKIIDLASGN